MLHTDNEKVREHMLEGCFGLEKESLRVYEDGHFARSEPPCKNHPHIVRDFAENQTEINTPVCSSCGEALASLAQLEAEIQTELASRSPREYLWPFSNPPIIRDEADIPVAQYDGGQSFKTRYRYYLAGKYGKYKMTFSGIHINFSFSQALLEADFACSPVESFQEYKNQLYLQLAARAARYGWILTALMAASPILDSSYTEKGQSGESIFLGLSSIRCSELGYWNFFTPVFDYSSLESYVESIRHYEQEGLIAQASELYYPIRLKPEGENVLENFQDGVSHIELRMADLNPLSAFGIDEKDLQFSHLFLVWLASLPEEPFTPAQQVYAAANFKNAAHFDLKTVRILNEKGRNVSMIQEAKAILEKMMEFYRDAGEDVQRVLGFEYWKLEDATLRYAWKLRQVLKEEYIQKGIRLAKFRQELALASSEKQEK